MGDFRLRVDTDIQQDVDLGLDTSQEGPFKILIHNDDVTPYEFVMLVLRHIFRLSPELAEHITWQAHTKGVAPVCTRPKSEAERLVNEAHTAARANGYPLTFSLEPK